jgi:nitrite reductase (NADH) large subunit
MRIGAPTRIEVDYDRSVRCVVVVGNGIAGNTAADHVRRRHPDCTIDIIGEELHPVYNRMGISRLVYGRSAMAGLRLLGDEWYTRHEVTPWLNTLVSEIDREAREVLLGTGERLPYDRLILAMGAASFVPPLEGIEREGVFVMRNADDAIGIRAYAQRNRCRRAVVVGGGLLGLEAAYALHERRSYSSPSAS